jgi:formylglycine-generating enzyme required for sulfatase activity
VTIAQFKAFVDDSGDTLGDEDNLRGLLNHPVVNVTWHEAVKYCQWLTERLREWPGTSEPLATLLCQKGWQVTLPSETEWEKAARGSDGRILPWGDEPDPTRANYDDTGLNTTGAVGCFPSGASPYGGLDMAANVWEWTRSLWGRNWEKPDYRYPDNPHDGWENLEAFDDILRVVRGGAFNDGHRFVRCAYRDWLDPYSRCRDIGFRVVVGPSS